MSVEELQREAEQLSEADRGQLAAGILATLGGPIYDVSDEEVARRVAETKSGEIRDISFDELAAGLRNLPGK